MITPSFGLTATERVLPNFAVDFTTAILDPRITFTRVGNTATYINSSGIITAINANLPRFDYNPTTLVCKGLLIEETRKNLFLNSLIDGTNLSTQIVTTTATATTISFYGTGSVVLSGTHSATVNGLGAYPTRTTYTFTPTAGALTATVSGTVQYAQIEAGAFATSFIPTDSTVGGITRNADVATMTGTNFSSWFNQSAGTFVTSFFAPQADGGAPISGSSGSYWYLYRQNSTLLRSYDGTSALNTTVATMTPTTQLKVASSYSSTGRSQASGGGSVTSVATTYGAAGSSLLIGSRASGANYLNNCVSKIFYYPQRLTDAEVQAFSK